MANKNITSPTAARIFAEWEKEGRAERPRTYLGASVIGDPCDMKLWLMFRGAVRENFDGRMYRLFNRGQREEAVFCEDLRRIRCEVRDRDEKTGQQFAVTALGGHFSGHLDAIARGFVEAPKTWHVCEFKTHSDASFKKLCKEGVKVSKPQHYAQMQSYMGLTGLVRAFYMSVNKDNDDLWCERVEFCKTDFDAIMARAKHIIDTCEPDRCANRPDDFRCKECACHSVCWHKASEIVDPSVPVICRTCCHSTAVTDGDGAVWTCRLGRPCGVSMTCDRHMILPVFVNAEIVDGGVDHINYSNGTAKFTNGVGGLSTQDLEKLTLDTVNGVMTVATAMPGSHVVNTNNLEIKYSGDGYELVFSCKAGELSKRLKDFSQIDDWSKPSRCEEIDGTRYFEYNGQYLVTIKGDEASLRWEKIPF